ncbi:hypothetical protein B0H14DRAFT_3881064 [Mycena olivaceomarginata]|nr:hypothetical protein B0H14DRAFT_3881064 [Mycena olivaceomarginata]
MAIADEVMLPRAPAPAVGINGIHAHDNKYVCLTSSQKGVFGRVPFRVDGEGNVSASHPVEALASIQSTNAQQLPDDFVFDCDGRAWVTVHPGALALSGPPAMGNDAGDRDGERGGLGCGNCSRRAWRLDGEVRWKRERWPN